MLVKKGGEWGKGDELMLLMQLKCGDSVNNNSNKPTINYIINE